MGALVSGQINARFRICSAGPSPDFFPGDSELTGPTISGIIERVSFERRSRTTLDSFDSAEDHTATHVAYVAPTSEGTSPVDPEDTLEQIQVRTRGTWIDLSKDAPVRYRVIGVFFDPGAEEVKLRLVRAP